MRIGIDVRYLSHGLVGGIHTYLKSLIPMLINTRSEHHFFLYADKKRDFEIQPLPDHVTLRLLPYQNFVSTFYNDLFMRNTMARDQLDLVHFPASFGFGPADVPVVITLQDEINVFPLLKVIKIHPKTIRTMTGMSYLHLMTSTAITRAKKVITVSQYSKEQIAHYSGIDAENLVVIPHACPPDIVRVEDEARLDDVRQRLELSKDFFLAEAFKNPAVIVRAWHKLPNDLQNATEIIFFSRSPDVLPVVHEAIEAGFARLFVRPDRRDLAALFSMTKGFIFPSWIEGFGIPLVEAMACGAPIIASDRGSIPEVAGDAALIIDAEDQDALANHMLTMLTQPDERQRLRERGFARLERYSWPRIIRQVLDTYEEAAAAKR